MQLSQYGIKPEHLLTDACLNIYTGAYYLALAFKKWGVSWEAVGAYNAGFRRTDRQAMRRLAYARRLRLSTGPSRQIKMPDNPGLLKTKDLMRSFFIMINQSPARLNAVRDDE
jgi:hypothetical protein